MDRYDLLKLIAESAFFHGLVQEDRLALADTARVFEHAEGEVLFRPKQLPTALYLVVEGVVEICRREVPDGDFEPVAYRGAGATLAESKMISGTPFNSLARFPEGGVTAQWARPIVLRKLFESRDFSLHYLQNLARRLEGTFADLGGLRGTELGGRLEHFDLPTILQTVVDSGSGGVLEISDSQGRIRGSVYTRDRLVGPIRCGALAGSEALFEILVNPPASGRFSFRTVRRPLESEAPLSLKPLLLEAARMQDELKYFASEVPGNLRLRAIGHPPEWGDLDDPILVDQVWHELTNDPCGWDELADRVAYSRCRVALVVRDMLASGLLEVIV